MYFEYAKDANEVGARIKARRKQLKLTQSDVGEALGCSPQQVQKYESGTTRISLPVFLDICRKLKAHPNYFFSTFRLAEDSETSTDDDLEEMLLAAFRSVSNGKIKQRIVNLVEALANSAEFE